MGRPDVLDPPTRDSRSTPSARPSRLKTSSPSADARTPGHNTAPPSTRTQQSPATNPQVTVLQPRSNPECGRSQVLWVQVQPHVSGAVVSKALARPVGPSRTWHPGEGSKLARSLTGSGSRRVRSLQSLWAKHIRLDEFAQLLLVHIVASLAAQLFADLLHHCVAGDDHAEGLRGGGGLDRGAKVRVLLLAWSAGGLVGPAGRRRPPGWDMTVGWIRLGTGRAPRPRWCRGGSGQPVAYRSRALAT
jgi:hypothetical protein